MLDFALITASVCALLTLAFLATITRKTQRPHRRRFAVLGMTLTLLVSLSLITGLGYRFWYTHRPLPPAVSQQLFEGVTFTRELRTDPRSLVINVLRVDLTAPGISFMVTPPEQLEGGFHLRARTTSQFLKEFGVQLAINGSDFEPWRAHFLDYYPHVGDPVNVRGFVSSRGATYSTTRLYLPVLYISANNTASFQKPSGDIYNAIPGFFMILKDGKWDDPGSLDVDPRTDLEPRTAIALDKTGHTMILITVDGRQPSYSEGVTVQELSGIAADFGGVIAMNMDGGGSSTMVMQGKPGESIVLNSPIDAEIVGRERAVANHLGVFARPVQP